MAVPRRWLAAALAEKRQSGGLALRSAACALVALAAASCWRFGHLLLRRLLAEVFNLAQPRPGAIRRLGGLRIPGGGETVLLSSVAYVREGAPSPTLLIRTPYDKRALELLAYAIAAQGFNVILQDCRGRYGSTGTQTFAACEDVDGVATVDWLASQGFKWYDPNRVVMFGISYLGIVQWALLAGLERRRAAAPAGVPKVRLAAMAPLFAASRAHDIFFRQNAFAFDFYFRYIHLMTKVNSLRGQIMSLFHLLHFEFGFRRHARAILNSSHLSRKLGMPVPFKYNARPKSRFWQDRDYSDGVLSAPPTLVASGWHDLMLDGSLRDFKALVEAHGPGHARLLVGPWHHLESIVSLPAFRTLLRTSIDFLQERTGLLEHAKMQNTAAVRVWVMGPRAHKGAWRDFTAWPPEEAKEELMVLWPGTLGAGRPELGGGELPVETSRSRLKYDPLDPTPSLGGSLFSVFDAGEKEQSSLEARIDVLRFDSPPLTADMTVVGQARLRVLVRASRPHFDLFARLCDVHPCGRSYNVCDAVLRSRGPSERSQSHGEVAAALRLRASDHPDTAPLPVGVSAVVDCELLFAATAKRFTAGHRIRLLVSCGAFPRFARHFGDSGQALDEDPLEVGPCELEVLHTEQVPSALWLPVVGPPGDSPKPRRTLLGAAAERARSGLRGQLSKEPLGAGMAAKGVPDVVTLRKIQSEVVF